MSACAAISGSGNRSLSPTDIECMLADRETEQNVLVGIENEDCALLYHSSPHSCSLCKGPHRELFCPAAHALVQQFDAATEDLPAGSVCNLNRLLYMYKLHFKKAFKPIDAGFADMSHVVKVLSPFAVPIVQLSGTRHHPI